MCGAFRVFGFEVFLDTTIPRSRANSVGSLYLLMVVVLIGETIFQSSIPTRNLYTCTNVLLVGGFASVRLQGSIRELVKLGWEPTILRCLLMVSLVFVSSFQLRGDGGLVPSFLVFQDCHLQCPIPGISINSYLVRWKHHALLIDLCRSSEPHEPIVKHTRSGSYKPGLPPAKRHHCNGCGASIAELRSSKPVAFMAVDGPPRGVWCTCARSMRRTRCLSMQFCRQRTADGSNLFNVAN